MISAVELPIKTIGIDQLCRRVEDETEEVRRALVRRFDHSEILRSLRRLQNTLSCLAETGNGSASEAFSLLDEQYPWLIRRVVDVLEFAAVRRFQDVVAARDACESINRSLFKIHALKQRSRPSTMPTVAK
jgi:hypothetical protein